MTPTDLIKKVEGLAEARYDALRAHEVAYRRFGWPSVELDAANVRCCSTAYALRVALGVDLDYALPLVTRGETSEAYVSRSMNSFAPALRSLEASKGQG